MRIILRGLKSFWRFYRANSNVPLTIITVGLGLMAIYLWVANTQIAQDCQTRYARAYNEAMERARVAQEQLKQCREGR